jgi:hypothetical protein
MAWQVFTSLGKYLSNPLPLVLLVALPLLYFVYSWIIRWSSPMTAETQGAGPGCLIQILGVFLQAIGISVVLLLLLPVLLGVSSEISWQAVEPMGFIAIRAGLFAMILVTIVSFFPYIGNLLGSSPGVEAFLLCWLTFRFLAPLYLHAAMGTETSNLFPPWWIVAILIILSFLFSHLLTTLVLWLGNRLKARGWVDAVGPSLDILGGILPFLYYARWVALAFKGV